MADDEREDETPSLELPSFSLRRKRRSKAPQEQAPKTEEQPEPEPEAAAEPHPEPEQTAVMPAVPTEPAEPPPPLFADEVAPPAAEPVPNPAPVSQPEPGPEPVVETKRRERSRPRLGGYPAVVVTGLLVGILMVGMTWGALRLCEVARGTSSCGRPGFLVLAAILVLAVLIAAVLLRAFDQTDSGSAAFLGVGLVAVVALLFLVDVIFAWWMIIVIPVVAMLSFAVARWVTTALVEMD